MSRKKWYRSGSLGLLLCGMIFFTLSGCGDKTNGGNQDAGCQGEGQRLLSVVGDPNRTLYPGNQEKLQVVFLEKCLGPVTGENISFEILWPGTPGDSTLDRNLSATQANGLAGVTLNAGDRTGSFQVWAHHTDDPNGVYFSINLKPVIRQLSRVGDRNLVCYTNETLDLTVKLIDLDTNAPVRGVNIGFSIVQPAPGDASLPSPQSLTSLSGLAAAVFNAGTTATSYLVVARGVTEEVGNVDFSIEVLSRQICQTNADCPPGSVCVSGGCREVEGNECATQDECPPGRVCRDGFCRPQGELPESCSISADCPIGYFCEGHQCYPCPDTPTQTDCEPPVEGCQTDADCPPGFVCRNGVCYPDNPPDVPLPELGGTWYTQHYFYLGEGTLSSLGEILEILNKAINYQDCDLTGIGFIDDLICDALDQYIPDWAKSLIDIFANLTKMLSELRAEGEMELTHLNPRELISGTETWDTILIYYVNQCCEGEPAGCNPYAQSDYPDCAIIDINREDLQYGDIGITVESFTGKIKAVKLSDNPPRYDYTLMIDPRKVHIELSKFVGFLIDLLIQMFTGYDSLDDALQDIIDCQAIGGLVEDLLGASAGAAAARACDAFKPQAGALLRGLLDEIGVGWKLLKFTGWATIRTEDDPPYGTNLGYKQRVSDLSRKCDGFCESACQTCDGFWEGSAQLIFSGDVTGGWYAER